VRLELGTRMASIALDHGDRAEALRRLDEARGLLEVSRFTPELRIALAARMAALRHRAGDAEAAERDAAAELARFDAERERIVDVFRGGALRPLAEAYHAMGDGRTALAIYARAVEEGALNPNSRPRADDLVATCCSLAVEGVEPGGELWTKLRSIYEGLGEPW
jgi:hypothetical protein